MTGDRGAWRWLALGGIVGPVAFVAAWLWCGAVTGGYSPVRGAISDLAASGAPTRTVMTAGFVIFGVGVPVYGVALRRALAGWSWLAAIVCGLSTLGVAAVPLGRGSDGWHGLAASVGYVALTLVPVLAIGALRDLGRSRLVVGSMAVAGVAGACLLATTLGPAHGLFQRAGLLAGDGWLVVSAVLVVRLGRLTRPEG